MLADVSEEDYSPYQIESRLCCEQLIGFAEYENIDIQNPEDQKKFATFISPFAQQDAEQCIKDLAEFLRIVPRLPQSPQEYKSTAPIQLDSNWSREEVIEYLESIRDTNITADLAFYAYRDMTRCDWRPFVKAAVERCPVSIEKFNDNKFEEVYRQLTAMGNKSIYDGPRLAQPDEVVNYNTGDGIEKAFVLANNLHHRHPDQPVRIDIDSKTVIVRGEGEYTFNSSKQLKKQLLINNGNYEVCGE